MLGIIEEMVACEANNNGGGEEQQCQLLGLPPGFRFHPTDDELITFYLTSKTFNSIYNSSSNIQIAEVDLNRCEPWDLPEVAKMGEKEWYFFSLRDRKYPTGLRTNRATGAGYWKATGKDREVYSNNGGGVVVGMKKTLVFYKGRAPRGEKTKWVMHEYRLLHRPSHFSSSSNSYSYSKEEWVICRIFHKMGEKKKSTLPVEEGQQTYRRHMLEVPTSSSSLPPLLDTISSSNVITPTTTTTTPTVLVSESAHNPILMHSHQNFNLDHHHMTIHHHLQLQESCHDHRHLNSLILNHQLPNSSSFFSSLMNNGFQSYSSSSFSPHGPNMTSSSSSTSTNNDNKKLKLDQADFMTNNNHPPPSTLLFKHCKSEANCTTTATTTSSCFQLSCNADFRWADDHKYYFHLDNNNSSNYQKYLSPVTFGMDSAAAALIDTTGFTSPPPETTTTSVAFNRAVGFDQMLLDPPLKLLISPQSWPPLNL